MSFEATSLYHGHTSNGEEVDLLLERRDGSLVDVEVKASGTVCYHLIMTKANAGRLRVLPPEVAIHRIEDACDQLVAEATRDHVPPVSCRIGCAYCCHQPVFITPLEGLAIRAFVARNGQSKAVAARTAAYLEDLDARRHGASGLAALQKNLQGRGPAPTDEQRSALFGPVCPFLVDGLCSIYPARPLMCREHVSFDAVEKCERDEPFFGLDKPLYAEVGAYFSRGISPKVRLLPVWEYDRAADAATRQRVPASRLDDLLRWKSGR